MRLIYQKRSTAEWLSILRVLATSLLLLSVSQACTADAGTGPSSSLTPEQVVKLQLQALQTNDADDTGIATAFGFASPGNRSLTGPLPRFALLLHQNYPELLNHRSARIVKAERAADETLIAVLIESDSKEIFKYLFQLSLQHKGPCSGCWMTDSVFRQPSGSAI